MKKILAMLLVAMLAIMPAMSMASGMEEAASAVLQSGKAINYEMSLAHGTLPQIDGLTDEVAQVINDVIDAIGLSANLSPTRSNGLLSMVKQMRLCDLRRPD